MDEQGGGYLDVYYTLKWSDSHFSACKVINVGKSWIKDVNPDTLAELWWGGGAVRDSGLQGLDYS